MPPTQDSAGNRVHYGTSRTYQSGPYTSTTHYTTTTVNQQGGSTWSRTEEKRHLQNIYDRFETYMKKVAEMSNQQAGIQASTFLTTIKNLEDSVASMKTSYESEIDELRNQLGALGSEKAELMAAINSLQERNTQLTADLIKSRTNNEALNARIGGLVTENTNLNRELSDVNVKLKGLDTSLTRQHDDHSSLHQAYNELQLQLDDLRRRLGEEERLRHEAEDAAQQLRQNLEFQTRIKDQELGQLLSGLEGSNSMVAELELKLREAAQNETDLPELLRRVREAAEEDIKRYRLEAEQEFSERIMALNEKYEADSRQLGDVRAENTQLQNMISDLQGKINTMTSQISGLEQERAGLITSIEEERGRHSDQITALQQRVEEMNLSWTRRMKEVSADYDCKISLQPEMESLLILLEEQEKRILGRSQTMTTTERFVNYPMQVTSTTERTHAHQTEYGPPTKVVGIGSNEFHSYKCREAPCTGAHAQTDHVQYEQTRTQQSIGPVSTVTNQPPPPVTQTRTQADADLAKLKAQQRAQSAPDDEGRVESAGQRPPSSTTHDYTTATNSFIAELKIHEVHPLGLYIRVHNTSEDKEVGIGNYQIQQNVGGRPVAIFRFPVKTKIGPNNTATVWCADSDPSHHQPPSDFICNEQQKWGTGPECTTILCKANGQAVAWNTPAHRFSRDVYNERPAPSPGQSPAPSPGHTPCASESGRQNGEEPGLTELPCKQDREPVFLYREKMEQPTLAARKHPHGQDPMRNSHPNTNTARQKTMGNDNSSFARQNRAPKTPTPDPVPAHYCGPSRLGASSKSTSVRGGRHVNKADYISQVAPPSSFMRPRKRDEQGVEQIVGQLDLNHQPPLPRPPLFSKW